MPRRLDQSFLEGECKASLAWPADELRLNRVAATLGPLQGRWLVDEALSRLGISGRLGVPLPDVAPAGHFHILVAVRGNYALLRPAFLLPLRWVRDERHSTWLPPTLVEHAEKMLAIHRQTPGSPRDSAWGLDAAFTGEEAEAWSTFDLSGLDIDPPSASAAMLAGLRLAEFGASGNGRILASVTCDSETLGRVESVPAKLDAADRAGASLVFLCEENRTEGDAWTRSTGRDGLVVYLPQEGRLDDRLAPFMREARAAPPAEASIDEHRRYVEEALNGSHQGKQRRDYYISRLAGRLAREHVARFPDGPGPGRRRLLAGVVSPGQMPTLAFLAHVYAPEAVLLVYDEEKASEDAAALKSHLENEAGVRRVEPLTDNLGSLAIGDLEQRLRERFHRFCEEHRASAGGRELACDLTAGLKRVSFAMLSAVPPETECIHVDSSRTTNDLHRIGTERIHVIRSLRPAPS